MPYNKVQYKEPWLASCYSIVLPGCGHLYGNMYLEGIAWVLVYIITQGLFVYTLLFNECPIRWTFLVAFFSSLFLPLYCGYNSYKKIKIRRDKVKASKRDVWLAIFFSIVFLPLGYIYLRKWFYVFISFTVFFAVLIFTDFPGNLVLTSAIFCFHIAFRISNIRQKAMKALFFLMVFYVFVGFIDDQIWCSVYPKYLFNITRVRAGVSMNPTLFEGDVLLGNIYEKKHGELEVGDIVTICPIKVNGEIESSYLIKRIVAVGNETIQIKNGFVFIDGEATNRIYTDVTACEPLVTIYDYAVNEPYTVPKGQYFVLGDFLYNSLDSRRFGAISEDQIISKVTKVLWPPGRMRVLNE